MLNFSEYELLEHYEQSKYLEEKLILLNGGKKFGQIVFMAGGAGSGKGFAVNNFLEGEKFKIRDVDAWKVAFQKLDKIAKSNSTKQKGFRSGQNLDQLNLRKGKDVFKLHAAIKKMDIKDKTLNLLLTDLKNDHKPNILFDVTAKSLDDFSSVIEKLQDVGYDSKNIHIVWVLTNYSVAVRNNANRDRVVPDDILLQTHEGAARTMFSIIKKKKLPLGANGAFHVILNNRNNTIFHKNAAGENLDGKTDKNGKIIRPLVVKSFTSLRLKREGRPFEDNGLQKELHRWISDNVPKTALSTKELNI